MPDGDDWPFDACQDRLRDATRIVLDLETKYERAVERAADAEAVYRSELGKAFAGYREAGKAVEESSTLAKREVAKLSRERDYAKDMVKVAAERLEDGRDSRRSLWRLIEWARERDLIAARSQVGQQQQLDSRMGVGAT